MKTKTLKIWYIVAGVTAGIGLLLCAIRFIAELTTTAYLKSGWDTVTYIGYGFIGLAILVLIGLTVYSYIAEKNTGNDDSKQENDDEKLLKYRSKNK